MKKDFCKNWKLNRMVIFLVILNVLFSTSCTLKTEQVLPGQKKDPVHTYELRLEQLRKSLGIPGMSVAVVKDQSILFAKGFGFADLENKIPATPQTPYNIASLTKTFSAAILMKLVEQGHLDLDEPMARIMADTKYPHRGETLQGYSGICQKIKSVGKNPFSPYGFLIRNYRCDQENILVRHHLTHTSQGVPGDYYRYNGFLFTFLTYVAQEASGKKFEELIVEHIAAPLNWAGTIPGMDKDSEARTMAARAKYYKRMGWGHSLSSYPVRLSASAGMVSTVLDLAEYDMAMDQDSIVSAGSKAAMFTPAVSNKGNVLPYGLGWFVQKHKEMKLVWHYGYAPGAYSSLILKVPEQNVTLILLANSDGASSPFNLGAGNVLTSPFASAFLELFTHSSG